jgi:hypothetical protein
MLPDISDLYASWQDSQEEQDIPDWAPRSVMYTSAIDENFLTRMEKKLGRVMSYGEALRAIQNARAVVPEPKRFIDRVRKCPECGRWHTDDINRYGMCADCIPF